MERTPVGGSQTESILAARELRDRTTRWLRKSGIQPSKEIWRQQVARDT